MISSNTYPDSPQNPKTAAIVCYMTPVGWLIAYFVFYKNMKSSFAAFHLRQTLLLHILSCILNILCLVIVWDGISSGLLLTMASLLVALWLSGTMTAISGQEKPLPIIGEYAQNLFRSL